MTHRKPVRFVTYEEAGYHLKGRTVAVVGSAPTCKDHPPGFIDSHEVVVRINNYKTGEGQGFRTDVFYSFFGTSIRKASGDLYRDGVRLCMCKLPNSQPIESEWHRQKNKPLGIDYRYVFAYRHNWWFCDTFIPDDAHFLAKFQLLGNHQPTTGFAAILDVLGCEPKSVFVTGFDFFTSGLHNVDEKWTEKNTDDPIRHRPDLEAKWMRENAKNYPLTFDRRLNELLFEVAA